MIKEYEIIMALLDPNMYSRPGSKMLGIKGIGIHWVGNATSKAINNRHYFNNLKNQTTLPRRYASSHEIIGLDGEVVICLPKDEVGFHVGAKWYKPRVHQLLKGSPNRYLYGIETCHPDWGGKFNHKTYRTLINRCADLLIEFDLKPSKDTLWRHWDVTGKDCPKYYIDNPGEWDKLVNDITKRYIEKINNKVEEVITLALQKWQKEMGEKAIDNLNNNKIVDSPEKWKSTLGDNVPQWLFWSIVDRIIKEVK